MSFQTSVKSFDLSYAKTIGMIAGAGSKTGRGFFNPVSLAVSSDGRIFVVNRNAPRVCVCNMD